MSEYQNCIKGLSPPPVPHKQIDETKLELIRNTYMRRRSKKPEKKQDSS